MTTKVYLIGVCGTAMATLAAMLKRKGLDVSGSDKDVYPPMSDFLAAEGIPAWSGYAADHITGDLDLVVVGNAISRGNVELEEVLDRKIRYCSLPEAIREHFLWGARSIVIAGTHGKTTTTSLAGWLLTHVRCEMRGDTFRVERSTPRAAGRIITGLWPGFPSDLVSLVTVLATQAEGQTLVHDWLYELRLFALEQMSGMRSTSPGRSSC